MIEGSKGSETVQRIIGYMQKMPLQRIIEQPEGWFARGWPAEITDALSTVVRDLRQRFGPDPDAWAWGRARRLELQHPMGRVPEIAPLLNRGPFAWGGDGNTISQAGTSALRPLSNPTAIASLRCVIDVGDWDAARWVLPGGQSGDPLSPHYDDQVPLWLRGEGIAIAWSEDELQKCTESTMTLRPLLDKRTEPGSLSL